MRNSVKYIILILSILSGKNSSTAQQLVEAKRWVSTPTYTKFETLTLNDLKSTVDVSYDTITLSQYGGRTDRKFNATGFFRLEKLSDRWIMIDPDGYEYFNVGCNAVAPNDYYKAKFESKKEWAKATTEFFKENGFNTYGLWSAPEEFHEYPMPYAVWGFFMGGYMVSRGNPIHLIPHHERDKLTLPVFDPEFENFCYSQATRQLASSADDPYLVGIFSDNELPFNENSLELYLDLPESDPNFIATKKWLESNEYPVYDGVYPESISEEFLIYLISTYYRITKDAIRSVDSNHLFMGSRTIASKMNIEAIWKASKDYLDIISQNVYGVWTPGMEMMDTWYELSGHPFIVTEFYAKGEDTGMLNTSGAGWIVKTQKDRGLFYQNFTIALMKHPACVGWHWFKYTDDDGGKESGTNKGIFDVELNPYTDLVSQMEEINNHVYWLRDRLMEPMENTGLKQLTNRMDVKIFPNPNEGQLYTQTNSLTTSNLTLYTITGQEVFETSFQGNSNIRLPGYLNGLYLVKIENTGRISTKHIIIL